MIGHRSQSTHEPIHRSRDLERYRPSCRIRPIRIDRPASAGLTRRQVLKNAGTGFGYLALAGHARPGRRKRRRRRGRTGRRGPLAPEAAALPGQGQADHLPVHERRHLADGHLGLQAAAPEGRRQGRAGRRRPDRRRSSSSASTARPAPGSPSCYPHMARHVDKLCFLRGLHTDTPAHPEAVIQLHTGTALASLTRPSHGRVAALRAGHREPGPARLRHDQPAAQLRRRGQLRQRVPAGPLPGDADQRRRLRAEPEGPDRPGAAAQAARPGPGDEPRPGGDVPARPTSSTA